jgi:cytochrome c peroxidase
VKYLGPTADQALNPFPNDVEQNIQEKKVCKVVKNSRYAGLYRKSYGEDINCKEKPEGNPAYRTSFKRLAVALAAWQMSPDVNSFSSKRDEVFRGKAQFSAEEAEGRTLFYGKARCSLCHNGVAEGEPADPTGVGPTQLYTDNRYHNIGIPFNDEIPTVPKGEKKGLSFHVVDGANVKDGFFRTPTLRNVDKGVSPSFVKAYGHNGYFKSLKQIVHFYNTRDVKLACADSGATVEEAVAANCWPAPEFPGFVAGAGTDGGPGDIIGNLGLTGTEEDAVSAYLESLTDKHTPTAP